MTAKGIAARSATTRSRRGPQGQEPGAEGIRPNYRSLNPKGGLMMDDLVERTGFFALAGDCEAMDKYMADQCAADAHRIAEREAIVAWLRRMQSYRHAQKLDARTAEIQILQGGMMQAYQNAADAIEQGRHLEEDAGGMPFGGQSL